MANLFHFFLCFFFGFRYQPVGEPISMPGTPRTPGTIGNKSDVASSVAGTPGAELVTVPAMGPEWSKAEMHNMTKAAKRERRQESRNQRWKAWNRGERGACGGWLTRKVVVFVAFALCVVYVTFFF
jgi:hypothetical protein